MHNNQGMLTMRAISLAISCLLITVLSYAQPANFNQAQSPPPSNNNKSTLAQKPDAVGRDAPPIPAPLPSTINITAGGKLELASDQEKVEALQSQQKWFSEFFNAKATDCVVALFTVVIGIYTVYLYRATEKLAHISSQQEQSTRIIERAYVFAKVEFLEPIVPSHEGTTVTRARALFINHGKTPAIIINMSGAPYVTDSAPQQLAPTPHDDRRLPEGWVIASGEMFQFPISMRITNRQLGEMEEGKLTLYCAGLIKYKDILDNERKTGYCWEYVPGQSRFQFCKESHLNEYT